jgi:hypothetical protein
MIPKTKENYILLILSFFSFFFLDIKKASKETIEAYEGKLLEDIENVDGALKRLLEGSTSHYFMCMS